ncbi:phenylacetate--CoA ligase family protein [uncultured Brevibacillus sp.]|uniref:phenylacetate--CoA ligase family protein n=1 Tax=uncultured Brevibacillus sp. TaxID=169970 RepID=UPI00259644D8|nr:hypothetical protein [uncultured Brevibacillus sp.]
MSLKQFVWKKRLSLQGKTLVYLDMLRKWQWLDKESLHQLQQERLKSLLAHAFHNTTYYHEILRECEVVDRLGNIQLDNFSNLPLLDKELIRLRFEELLSSDKSERNWYENTSGGSTGVPVRFIQDEEYFFWNQAIKALDDEWTGRAIIDKQVRLWGSERDLMVGRDRFRTQVGRWLRNERWLNSLRMTQATMREYIDEINRFRPVQILAYVESLYELARYSEREKISLYSPRAIMTSAGTLYPHMRETIERVFQTKMFNRYGSTEVGDVACECDRHKGLHVSTPTHFVEIVRPDGTPARPGEVGEIIITLLVNQVMPFVRYRIGDMGVWSAETCDCGRGLPLLQEVIGRRTDMFIDQQGRWIDGRVFLFILDPKPYIQKFQVIQEKKDMLRVLIVPVDRGVGYQEEIESIRRDIQKIMMCSVHFEFCDEIEPSPSGKYLYTISNVRR